MTRFQMTALAAALLGAACVQAADVTVYGLIDTGLNYQHIDKDDGTSATNKAQLKGSQLAPNRWGMKGTEDLGNGLKVGFMLEGQFGSDDGTMTGNRLFHRAAELSLISDTYGTLTMGRMGALRSGFGSTGIWGAKTGPFSNSAGDFIVGHKYIMPGGFKAVDNALTYKSPKMAGAQLHLQYSSKMDANNAVQKDLREFRNESDRLWAVGVTYGNGPLNVVAVLDGVMYSQKVISKRTAKPNDSLSFSLEADYNFGVAKVYAAGMIFQDVQAADFQGHTDLVSLKGETAYDGYSLELGADIPLMGGTAKVNAGWMEAEDSDDVADNANRLAFAAGYVYPLSKRTQVYTIAGYVRDKSNSVANKTLHPNAMEFVLGLKHSF